MTIINPNSIAGITSVTAEAGVMNFYKSDGTLAGLQLNGVNFNTTAGVSTFNNLYVGGTITYEDVKNVDSVGIITARAGLNVTANIDTDTLNVSGISTFGGNVLLGDDDELKFGAGNDGSIKSDGSNFLFQGSGTTYVRGSTLRLSANGGSGGFNGAVTIDVSGDERVQLKYGSGTKLVTTNTGVTVTGTLTATSFVGGLPITSGADNRVITASSASAIQGESNLTFDGSTLTNTGGAGVFKKNSNNYILVGSTDAGGATVIIDGDSNGDGSGGDYAYIQHDTSGNLNIVATNPADSSSMIFNTGDGSEALRITSAGAVVTGGTTAQASDAVTLMPDGEVTAAGFYFSNNIGSPMNSDGIRRHTTGTLSIDTASAERIRIDSGGQVSIRSSTTAFDGTGDLDALQLYYETDSGQASIGPYSSGGSTHLSFYTNAGGAAASEKLRIMSDGNIRIGAGSITLPKATQGGVDIDSGAYTVCIGGNVNTKGRTDSTDKLNRITSPHRTNAEEPVMMFSAYNQSGSNSITYGGGSSICNAGTQHVFYTAANTTTLSGTERFSILSDGNVKIGNFTAIDTRNTGGLHIQPTKGISFKAHSSSSSRNWRIRNDDYQWGNLDFSVGTSNSDWGDADDEMLLSLTSSRRVGIRNTAPQEMLHVGDGSGTEGGLKVAGQSSSVTDDGLTIDWTSSNEARFFSESAGNATMHFYTTNSGNRSERLRINNLGEVTIGTGNDGTSMTEFGSGTGGLTLDDIGSSHTALRLSHGNDDTYLVQASNSNFYISQYGTGVMIFGVGSSGNERLRIASNGSLGVNVTNPQVYDPAARALVVGEVDAYGHTGMTIASNGTDKQGTIYFADGTGSSSYRGRIEYQHSDDSLRFGTAGGGGKSIIDSSGRLGIGSGATIRAYVDIRETTNNTPLLNLGHNDGSFYRQLGTVGPSGDDGRSAGSYRYLHVRLRTVWNDTSMTMFRITGYTAYSDYTESYFGCYRYNHNSYRTNPYGQIVHNQKRATLHSVYNTGADPGYLVLVLDSATNYIGYIIEHIGAGGAYASYMQQDLEIIDTKRDTTTNDQWPS